MLLEWLTGMHNFNKTTKNPFIDLLTYHKETFYLKMAISSDKMNENVFSDQKTNCLVNKLWKFDML